MSGFSGKGLDDEAEEKDESLAALEEKLADEKDGRNEDRFIFIVIIVILLDVIFFWNVATWTAPVVILGLELLILIPLARRLGVDEASRLIDRLLEAVGGNNKGQ